jgi:hypothetical protein
MNQKELDSAVEVMLTIAKMARKPFVTRRAMGMIQKFKDQNAPTKAKKKTE